MAAGNPNFEDMNKSKPTKQEKAEEKCKCHCHCTDCGRNADLKHIFKNCNHCEPQQEKAETKEIKDITFDLVEMIMRMATSKKKKETFYVSKVAEKLDKLIAKELERERAKIGKKLEQMIADGNCSTKHDKYCPCKVRNKVLHDVLQAIKEEQPEEI